jgi:hypothetical protein
LQAGTDRIENSVLNSSYIVACEFVAVGTYLFAKSLLSNGSCTFAYLEVGAQQQVDMLRHYVGLRLVVEDWEVSGRSLLKRGFIISAFERT